MDLIDNIKEKLETLSGTDFDKAVHEASELLHVSDVINRDGYNDEDENVLDMLDHMHPNTRDLPLK